MPGPPYKTTQLDTHRITLCFKWSQWKEGAFQPCVPKAEVEYKISIEREGYEPIRQSVKASSTLLTFFMKPRAK